MKLISRTTQLKETVVVPELNIIYLLDIITVLGTIDYGQWWQSVIKLNENHHFFSTMSFHDNFSFY